MSNIPVIAFPEDISSGPKRLKTLVYLVKLLYGSGLLLTVIYAVSIAVIKPMLELQFDRRLEILTVVGARLRNQVFAKIVKRIPEVPDVMVKYGDKFYCDSMVQTDDRDTFSTGRRVAFKDDSAQDKVIDLNEKLTLLKMGLAKLSVTDYENNDDNFKPSEMQPLKFQLNQLNALFDSINERIFRRGTSRDSQDTKINDVKKSIQELRSHALKNY